MVNYILQRFWAFGLCVALSLSSLLALVFSALSLIENPGGIFRDATGTNWPFIYDTAMSWFVPTLLPAFFIAAIAHLVVSQLVSMYRSRRPEGE